MFGRKTKTLIAHLTHRIDYLENGLGHLKGELAHLLLLVTRTDAMDRAVERDGQTPALPPLPQGKSFAILCRNPEHFGGKS